MTSPSPGKVAYILKMFPRFSETFILGEILELEREGVEVHVFSLKMANDAGTHADVARVRAAVTYVPITRVAEEYGRVDPELNRDLTWLLIGTTMVRLAGIHVSRANGKRVASQLLAAAGELLSKCRTC